jgi:Peptidase M66
VDLDKLLALDRLDALATESLLWHPLLGIASIEVTQATQYYKSDEHLTDPADRGADNSIRLVALKPAWVRVYVRSAHFASGISATLEVQRRALGFLWNHVATLNPEPSSATSVPPMFGTTYAATRGSLAATFNFIVPADEMFGTLRLIAGLTSGFRSAESSVVVAVTLRQTLRFAGVMISYNGPASTAPNAPNLTIAAPTLTDLQAMSGTALTLFPVESTADFRTAGTLVQTTPLQTASFPTSGCGAPWDALHARVVNARTADGNQPGWIYYGLLPSGVPMGPVGGCGGGGVAVGPIGAPGTLAHESGHACGLEHAPAGGAPNPDPNYPAYEPYDPANTPQGSIGEYGLDVNNGNIKSPAIFRDIMGYAAPKWISPYHYGLLLDNSRLNPKTVGIDHLWWHDLVWEEIQNWPIPDPQLPVDLELPMYPPSRPHDVISLIVKVERATVTEVMHVARTQAHTQILGAVETSFTARLRDAREAVLSEGRLLRLETSASPCGCGGPGEERTTYLAQAFLDDVAPGATLEVVDENNKVVWRREAPAESPRVQPPDVKVDRRGNATVSWEASEGVHEFWLRWSRDGEEWQAVATGLTERRARIPAGGLPSGDGLMQVVAHDGFFSSYSEPAAITVPARAPQGVILHPVDGYTYAAGQSVRLWASAADAPGDLTAEAVWLVDGQEVARGLDAFTTLEAGERTVSLRLGGTGVRPISVSVKVTD